MKKYILFVLAALAASSALADSAFRISPWTPVDGAEGLQCRRYAYDADKIADQELRLVVTSWNSKRLGWGIQGFPAEIAITSHQWDRTNVIGASTVEVSGRNAQGEVRYQLNLASTQYTVGILYCRYLPKNF